MVALKKKSTTLILLFIFVSISSYFIYHEANISTISSNSQETENIGKLRESSHLQFLSTQGIHTYIGMNTEEVVEILGKPNRIDRTPYDYDWWIYNNNLKEYIQIGIEQGKVVTVYVIGETIDISPFHIGQAYSDINQQFSFNNQLSFNTWFSSFRFELNDVELNTRPLIELDDVYIQLYFDTFTKKLSSIRYMNKETLIKQRPYELVYRGDLLSSQKISDDEWRMVEEGTAAQILDLTNIIRSRHGIKPVHWNEEASQVAYKHSKEMNLENYFSHQSPKAGGLADRLVKGDVPYELAGENIAARYVDGIAAVEGWLNSEGHRDTLLNERYTHLGVGVFEKHYTQNFIQLWKYDR